MKNEVLIIDDNFDIRNLVSNLLKKPTLLKCNLTSMRKTRILEVSDFHKVGGAAIAAGRISSSLRQKGIEIRKEGPT